MSIRIIANYDLTEDSNHSAFKKELEAKDYSFSFRSKRLPSTTCTARFKQGVTEDKALSIVRKEFKIAKQNVNRSSKCKITRILIACFEESDAIMDNTLL